MTTDETRKAAEEWANGMEKVDAFFGGIQNPARAVIAKGYKQSFIQGVAYAQRWVPCSERLPERHQIVWASTGSASWDVEKAVFRDGQFTYADGEPRRPIGGVTAWMPLPPKPEGKV